MADLEGGTVQPAWMFRVSAHPHTARLSPERGFSPCTRPMRRCCNNNQCRKMQCPGDSLNHLASCFTQALLTAEDSAACPTTAWTMLAKSCPQALGCSPLKARHTNWSEVYRVGVCSTHGAQTCDCTPPPPHSPFPILLTWSDARLMLTLAGTPGELPNLTTPTTLSGSDRPPAAWAVSPDADVASPAPQAPATRRRAAMEWTAESIRKPPGQPAVSRRQPLLKYLTVSGEGGRKGRGVGLEGASKAH